MAETVVPALSPPMLLPLASALLIEEWTGSHEDKSGYEDALSDFSRALELAPEDAYIHAFRGKALEFLGRRAAE